MSRNVSNDDILHLHNNGNFLWIDIDRWNYKDVNNPKPPKYTLYTMFTAGQYFGFFWLILTLQICVNIFIKRITSQSFRKEANLLQKFMHGLENCNIPSLWKDWDEGFGSVDEHKQRFRKSNIEMVSTIFTSLIFNSLMLLPFCFTGKMLEEYFFKKMLLSSYTDLEST